MADEFPYVWFWKPTPLFDRKHERCRILEHGKGRLLIEFERDGLRMNCSRYAIRKVKT